MTGQTAVRADDTAASHPHPPDLRLAAGSPNRLGLSLRLRLMLMLLAVFGVIQVSVSIIHLLYVRRTANAVLNERVTAAVDSICHKLAASRAIEVDDLVQASAGSGGPLFEKLAVSVYDANGSVVATTVRPPVPFADNGGIAAAIQTPRETGTRLASVTFHGGKPAEEAKVASCTLVDSTGRQLLVVAAASNSFVRTLSDRVSLHIVLLTPVGLIAAMVAGWLIAGVAVRPFDSLSRIARQLGPDNLANPIEIDSSASELAKLQIELEEMRRRLEAGYESQERFVANVSHEIKTPIATVLTEAQTLDTKRDEEVVQFVRSTEEEMRRLAKLVESFLTLTRVRHGKPLQSTARLVSINELVIDSVQHCSKAARLQGVTLVPQLADEQERDLTILGDPELLRTLLDNLLRNAVRFSPGGNSVEIEVKEAPDDRVRVSVRDHGAAIPDTLLPSVFERYAVAKRQTGPARGSGLGLEIAQGIAELHRGNITVRNVSDGGCEFTLQLPLTLTTETA